MRLEGAVMEIELTNEQIRAAVVETTRGRRELADSEETGLRLRISESSSQWCVLARGAGGERLILPVGKWPGTSVEQARQIASAIKGAVAEATDCDEVDLSLGAILSLYKTRRLSQLRRGAGMARALEATLAPLYARPLAEVTRREVSSLIDDMADRAPIHANRVLAYTKAFFNWAVGRGYMNQSVATPITKPTRERSRERTPTLSEVCEIWSAAGFLAYPFGPIVRLLILTAARRDEVGAIRSAELSLGPVSDGPYWLMPAERSKNARGIRTPLSTAAKEILEEALAARTAGGDYVFSTTGRSAVSGWSRAKTRLDTLLARARAGRGQGPLEPWRFHDLRRAFATHACDNLHVDPAVVDRCLNHVGASTTSTVSRIYARNEMFDQRRDALTRWASLVASAVSQSGPYELAPTPTRGENGKQRSKKIAVGPSHMR
jgi:integrase